MSIPVLENYIGGKFVASSSSQTVDVINPAAQSLLCRVPISTLDEMQAALDAAQSAFPAWSATPVQQRARVMMKLLALIQAEKNSKELDKLRHKKSRTKTERSPDALPSGITKPVAISDELAKFLGVAPGTLVPRNEVTKGVSGFVKSNGLSDPANKQRFVLDDREPAKKLRVLLGNPGEDVTYFNLQRYLKHHYLPMAPSEPTPKTPKAPKAAAVTPVLPPEPVAEPVKKKILVKKVKTQLSEEA
jgi:chromatin remodeling complex protein RSC6